MPQVVYQGHPSHRALTLGQAVEHVDQGGREFGEQLIHVGSTGQDCQPQVTGTRLVHNSAGLEKDRARALRGRRPSSNGVDVRLATNCDPSHAAPSRPESRVEDGGQRIGPRRQQPLELVARGEPEGRQSLVPVDVAEFSDKIAQQAAGPTLSRRDRTTSPNRTSPVRSIIPQRLTGT
ncbi:MAG: hypothetical protein ABSH34_37565 [Verrucomicrobiota bacterium]